MAVSPSDPSTLYVLDGGAGGGRDLHRSQNGGSSWTFIRPFRPLESHRRGRDNCWFSLDCYPYNVDHTYGMIVAIDPRDSRSVVFSSAFGLFTSGDGGDNWSVVRFDGVLPDEFHYHGVAIYPKDSNVRYVATGGGVASNFVFTHVVKTTDGGLTWTLVDNGLPGVNYHPDVFVHPDDPNVAYLTSTTTGFGCQPSHNPNPHCQAIGIYKTVNGGASWAPANQGLADLDVLGLTFHPRDANVLYAAAGESVHVSRDAGGSWTRALTLTEPSGGVIPRPSSIAIDPRNPMVMVVGLRGPSGPATAPTAIYGGVRVSFDGGASWRAMDDGLTVSGGTASIDQVIIDPRNRAVYAAGGGVFTATLPAP